MAQQRIHVVMSSDIVADIDRLVGRRARSRFIEESARLQLIRLQQAEALKVAVGSWSIEEHDELGDGAAAFVRFLRRESGRPPGDAP